MTLDLEKKKQHLNNTNNLKILKTNTNIMNKLFFAQNIYTPPLQIYYPRTYSADLSDLKRTLPNKESDSYPTEPTDQSLFVNSIFTSYTTSYSK